MCYCSEYMCKCSKIPMCCCSEKVQRVTELCEEKITNAQRTRKREGKKNRPQPGDDTGGSWLPGGAAPTSKRPRATRPPPMTPKAINACLPRSLLEPGQGSGCCRYPQPFRGQASSRYALSFAGSVAALRGVGISPGRQAFAADCITVYHRLGYTDPDG